MSNHPIFLRRLSLGADADERAIRRAYARELKQIDQEADPAGFQSLRETYDAALRWARQASGIEPAGIELVQAEIIVDTAEDHAAPRPVAQAASEQLSDQNALGDTAFAEFLQQTQNIAGEPADAAEQSWLRALRASLDDLRLINIAARDAFERRIADLLAGGWRPGNETLFPAAIAVFGWDGDRRRIQAHGAAGDNLDRAMDESAMFEQQPFKLIGPQRLLIERLRDPRAPSSRELVRHGASLEMLIARFPTLLLLITDVDNIIRWRQLDDQLPRWRRRLLTVTGFRRVKTDYDQQTRTSFNWGWLVFVTVIGLSRFAAHDSGTGTPAAPAPETASALVDQGDGLLNKGENKEAIAKYTKAIALDPNFAAAYAERAMAYVWLSDKEHALQDIATGTRLNASDPMLYRARGIMELKENHPAEAIAALTRSLELYPNHPFTHLWRALAHASAKDYAKALADIDETLRLEPGYGPRPYVLRIQILLEQGEQEPAMAQVEAMLKAYPENTQAYMEAAYTYLSVKQRERAIATLNQGVVGAPDAEIYLLRAQLRPKADFDGRNRDIDTALALAKLPLTVLYERVGLQIDTKDFAAAIATLDSAIAAEPATSAAIPRLLAKRGVVHAKMGDLPLATADFTAARQAAATSAGLNNICWTLATNNVELQTALANCDAALKKNPQDGAALDSKGFVLLRLGRYRDAIKAYDATLAGGHEFAASFFGRGIAKRHLGDVKGSVADLAAARKRQPYIDMDFANYGISLD